MALFRVTDGKRVRLTFTDLDLHYRYYDYVYITWEICNKDSLFSYDVRLSSYTDAPVRNRTESESESECPF